MKEIDISELKSIINNIHLIDIRDNFQYVLGHIPSAINIPMNFLITNPENYLNKDEEYYINCEFGSRSKKTCMILNSKGFKTINVIGGYNAYKLSLHDLTK